MLLGTWSFRSGGRRHFVAQSLRSQSLLTRGLDSWCHEGLSAAVVQPQQMQGWCRRPQISTAKTPHMTIKDSVMNHWQSCGLEPTQSHLQKQAKGATTYHTNHVGGKPGKECNKLGQGSKCRHRWRVGCLCKVDRDDVICHDSSHSEKQRSRAKCSNNALDDTPRTTGVELLATTPSTPGQHAAAPESESSGGVHITQVSTDEPMDAL